jgi:hypothetical protein
MPCTPPGRSSVVLQNPLYRPIGFQFQGKRHIHLIASDHEKRHGRDTLWA